MIAIVNLGIGNLQSIRNMLYRCGFDATITNDPEQISEASSLILPGVGAFDRAISNLDSLNLREVLNRLVRSRNTPILGICLGMHLLARRSEEGSERGLGWINADVRRFRFGNSCKLKVPHMGWNEISITKNTKIFKRLGDSPRFYFAHSYHLDCFDSSIVIASCRYGYSFPSVIKQGNIHGVQFHPEKSHRFGMSLLASFCGLS